MGETDNLQLTEALGCVGSGWATLVTELYELCEKHNVCIDQVKEKFGGLRFYVGPAPQNVYDAIDAAEERSYHVCEVCGNRGKAKRNNNGWLKTLCENCNV